MFTLILTSKVIRIYLILIYIYAVVLENQSGKCQVNREFAFISAMIVPALVMIGIGNVDCSSLELAMILLLFCYAMRGFRYAAFLENALDIDPHFANIIFGFANMGGALGGYLSSVVVGNVTVNLFPLYIVRRKTNKLNSQEWQRKTQHCSKRRKQYEQNKIKQLVKQCMKR
ncbi:hypothetical protein KUTeg_000514 [Tegillarca granosa]|uniref:Uncharacterized protein n=1 Tax=Tegillarca granosa TaxID=220873 RepID=A0ABQ9FXR7_TEGGR|nr:hypothetical protein KUTeg_000514 [Tegillarca granosa]